MPRPIATTFQRKEMFLSKVEKTSTCWLWKGTKSETGYGMAYRGDKVIKAHRFSYELFVGEIRDGGLVLHSCNNRLCVNPQHLRIGNHKDNFMDAINAGTAAVGINNAKAKLNEEQLKRIRELYVPWKMGCLKLSRIFNISRAAVSRVVSGKSYREVASYGS